MDTAGIAEFMKAPISCLLLVFLYLALISSCASTTVEKEQIAIVKSTPLTPESVPVDKPVNVSFSTYSKDWPVGWQWIDPDEKYDPTPHDVKKGVLRVSIPTKKDLAGEKLNAPRYIKPITGDFEIETRVKFLPKENYQGAGLLIFNDDRNYIRFERAYGGTGGGGEGLRIDVRKGDSYQPVLTPDNMPTEIAQIDMKIVRNGRMFSSFWREDENTEWRLAAEYEADYPATILTGLVASNTAREVTAEFAYIKLQPVVKR